MRQEEYALLTAIVILSPGNFKFSVNSYREEKMWKKIKESGKWQDG